MITDNGVIFDYVLLGKDADYSHYFVPDGIAIRGDKVIFLNENGYDSELEHAAKVFTEGQILIVESVKIGSYSSYYKFNHLPNFYNSVMFEKV